MDSFAQMTERFSSHNRLTVDDSKSDHNNENGGDEEDMSMAEPSEAYTDSNMDVGDLEEGDEENDENKKLQSQNAVQEMINKEKEETTRIQNRVLLFLATASVLVCIAIGLVSAKMETRSMENSFEDSANFLFKQFHHQAAHSLRAMASLSASFTMMYEGKQQVDQRSTTLEIIALEQAEDEGTWFVTDPSFQTRAHMVQDLLWKGGAAADDDGYDRYSESVILTSAVLSTTQSSNPAAAAATTVRYPIWQVSPAAKEDQIRMLDLKSIPTAANAIDYAIEQQAAVVSGVLTRKEQTFLGLMEYQQDIDSEEQEEQDPTSLLIVPIFDTLDTSKEAKVVGTVIASFRWSGILSNILPQDEWGVHAVFSTATCGESDFSYKLLEDVQFLGMSDQHQSYYDHTEETVTLETILQDISTAEGTELEQRSYTYASDYECTTGMHIRTYESSTYRQLHKTRAPALVTGTVVSILVLVIILVLSYASKLDYRMNRTTEKYARTQHLINTLFPKEVQEKMFQDTDLAPKVLKGDSPLLQIQSTMKEKEANQTKALPIAERFESATVMFADISGFTEWSSGREPGNVFELLETIYNAFDKVAKEKGIFKVETIGDCYMCVCGLPERRDDHASAMCIFSQSCLRLMKKLTRDLQHKLGGETSKLALRVGMNSGPVTAGVLRGEKSRFQLFGDTVNTASRMESTGLKNRIQISNSTADLLKEEGREHWFVSREGGVEAKGKGRLDTFWLAPASMSATTGTRSGNSGTESNVSGASGTGSSSGRQRRASTLRKDSSRDDQTGSRSGDLDFPPNDGHLDFDASQTERSQG